MLNWLTNV